MRFSRQQCGRRKDGQVRNDKIRQTLDTFCLHHKIADFRQNRRWYREMCGLFFKNECIPTVVHWGGGVQFSFARSRNRQEDE